MTLEQLDEILDYPTIKSEPHGGSLLKRWRKLTIDGKEYEIEWYCNVSYLHHDGLTVLFDRVERSNTWPHKSKMNLQFYDNRNEICAILLIEQHSS